MEEVPNISANPYAQEEGILLSIFSAEVWDMVFLKCDSNTALLLINSSQSFRNWLLPKRTAYLFPLVFMILKDDYLQLKLLPPLKISRAARKQPRFSPSGRPMPPSALQFLDSEGFYGNEKNVYTVLWGLQDTLKFRLVCKHWCQTINALHLQELYRQKTDINRILEVQRNPTQTQSVVPWMETKLNLKKPDQIIITDDLFIKSKFLGRAIVIENWNDKTLKTLKQIGQKVLHCTMLVNSRDKAKSSVYLNVRNALGFLPNLKALEIEDVDDFWLPQYLDNSQGREPLRIQKLRRVVNQNPIGKLVNLQLLRTRYLPSPVFNELIRKNSRVKTLLVDRSFSCGTYNVFTSGVSALEELSYQILTDSDLEMLGNVEWKLTKFYVKVEISLDRLLDRLFELFNGKWKNTTITLNYFGVEHEGLGKEFCLEFLR